MGVRKARQRYRELRRLGMDHEGALCHVAAETGRAIEDVARRTKWDARMSHLQAERAAPHNDNQGAHHDQ
jgi:hypothetical protein